MIPDSISPKELAALLAAAGEFPLSDTIPELNFGTEAGGPCDLQFALMQLIQKSADGISVPQALTAALYLLHTAWGSLQRTGEDLAECTPEEIPNELDREQGRALIAHFATAISQAAEIGESVHHLMIVPLVEHRANALGLKPSRLEGEERSTAICRLLISDEALASMNLEREPVVKFFAKKATL